MSGSSGVRGARRGGVAWGRRLSALGLAAVAVMGMAVPPAGAAPPVGAVPSAQAEPSAAALDRVDAYAEEQRARTRVPGMALAVVKGGDVVHRRAWGEDGNGDPVTRRTPFLVGSLSKPITATAVMHLAEADRLRLDAPVRRYLPWFEPSGPEARRMTVRHLLNQTSGMTERDGLTRADRFDNAPGGVERVARSLAQVRTVTPPGARHAYSNANYMLLGAVVERVTRRPFGPWLRDAVLRPLGMDGAIVDARDAERRGLAPGHRYFFGRTTPFEAPFDASGVPYGYVGADIDDLAAFAAAQLGGGGPAARAVVSPDGLRELHEGTVKAGTSHRYGLGWRDDSFDDLGERVVWHGGATPGFHGTVALAPGRDLAVVVQHNAYNPLRDEQLNSTAFGALRILLGGRPEPAPADPMLATLLTVVTGTALALALALTWSVFRLVRPGSRKSRARRRGWVIARGVCAAAGLLLLAFAAVYVLPRQVTGVDLAQILLFVPDAGRTLVAVAVLACALAVARGAHTVRALRPLTRTAPSPGAAPAGPPAARTTAAPPDRRGASHPSAPGRPSGPPSA
ncbi:serine hydrolase domain-containing protein [Streptomyces luteocolor]|uniref:serine hydrolase domain-containing protein n=1 Tax=Streptomyces luteocolor TaxID=285500 RepID=UPI00099FD2AD|nr:serine hydrolase domain-containing protein [Streptomyces luteocolor]